MSPLERISFLMLGWARKQQVVDIDREKLAELGEPVGALVARNGLGSQLLNRLRK